MPTDFGTLVIVIIVGLIVLKALKATAKLMITAVIIAVAIWFLISYVPEYLAFVPEVTTWVRL